MSFFIVLTDSDFTVSVTVSFYFPLTVIVTVNLIIFFSYFAISVTVNLINTAVPVATWRSENQNKL